MQTIAQLVRMYQSKELSPVEVVQEQLAQIRQKNPVYNAYITVLEESALEEARAAEEQWVRGEGIGKLHGIPIAVKDNINTAGVRTTSGSRIHGDYIPEQDATVIRKLKEAGAIIMGKLNLHEYACGVTTVNPHTGNTLNPLDVQRTAGGSSGGSAAALAAGMAIATLGTDTAGSVRIPSACCGTVGLKPTFGLVSKTGVFPLAWSMDHVGPMTRTVEDAALLLEVMSGYDHTDPFSVQATPISYSQVLERENLQGLVIGVVQEFMEMPMHPAVKEGLTRVMGILQNLGAEVRPVSIPQVHRIPFATPIIAAEAAAVHLEQYQERAEDFGQDVRRTIENGLGMTATDYMRARQHRWEIVCEVRQVLEKVDVLMTPTMPIPAPLMGEEWTELDGQRLHTTREMMRFTSLANLTGLPALVIPSGKTASGLPVSVQWMGRPFGEQTLLSLGHLVEKALGYSA